MTGLWSVCFSSRRLSQPSDPHRNTPIFPSLQPLQAFLWPKTNTLRLTAMLAVPGHRVVVRGFPGSSIQGWSPDVSNGSLEEPFAEVAAFRLQQE